MKVRNLAVSRTPAIPNTRFLGNPLTFRILCTIASRGLVTGISIQLGEYLTISSVTAPVIFMLVSSKSSRLIPGFRAIPAVITTTSEFAVSA